jgi:hypothetical protein
MHTLRHYSVRLRGSRRLPYFVASWSLVYAVVFFALFFLVAWR